MKAEENEKTRRNLKFEEENTKEPENVKIEKTDMTGSEGDVIDVEVRHAATIGVYARSICLSVGEDATCADALRELNARADDDWQLQDYENGTIGKFPREGKASLSNEVKRDLLRLERPIGQKRRFQVGGPRIEPKKGDGLVADRVREMRAEHERHISATMQEDCGPDSQAIRGGYIMLLEQA